MARLSKQEKAEAAAAKVIAEQKAAAKAEKKKQAAAEKAAEKEKEAAKKEAKEAAKAAKKAEREAAKNKPKEFTAEQKEVIEAEIKHKQKRIGNKILKNRIAKQVWKKRAAELLG